MLLTRFVDRVLPKLPSAEPWDMNAWMDRLRDADDPAVIPFLNAYLRHPRLSVFQTSPNSSTVGGGISAAPVLLLNLTSQGSSDARQLLYECSDRSDYPLVIDCSRAVAVFDRSRATARLRAVKEPITRYWAADALVQLGDPQGIPMLIEELGSPQMSARSLAFQDLRRYTQEDIPYDANAPTAARKAAADEWRRWWGTVSGTFAVKTRAARIDLTCCRF
jgi:hypothetical protein